ncbi:MAG: hypothetical protein V3V28_08655 [Polaribacter sp.]|uniref:hypothetical protein n=1 Tax=Polaribacter sp. TaxID=1920175 RepID=UPI002F35CA30
MSKVIRNSKAYDSGDVDINIAGVPSDLVEISYNTEQEHQMNYTLKNKGTSWSKGKISDTCTATFMMQDIAAIEKAAGGNLLNVKPFYINVTFTNEYSDIINDTILAKFQDQGREVTGDMGLNKQHTLFVLDTDYNNF